MGWSRYKLVALFFIAAVVIGFSIVLTNFNRIVAPAVPVSIFRFESAGHGKYHLEFLGEDIVVKWPVLSGEEILRWKNTVSGNK